MPRGSLISEGGPRVPPHGGPEADRIVDLARSYVGVPWKHQGRTRAGLDCIGLLYRIWCDLGFDPGVDETGYAHLSDGRQLRRTLDRLLIRAPGPRSGGVVLMAQRGVHPLHVGLISEVRGQRPEVRMIVHANARARAVVEQGFVPALGLRPVAYFAYPDGSRRDEGGPRVPPSAAPGMTG